MHVRRIAVSSIVRLLGAVLLTAAPSLALAQDLMARGTVRDSAGKPIADADVSIVALRQLTRTDAQGHFLFAKLPRGQHEVSVRRLGYAPEKVDIIVNEAVTYSYEIVLRAQPSVLAGVDISAPENRARLGIEDFYRRRARGIGGHFFTRDEIEAQNAKRTSDALRGVPGARFVRTRGGQGIRFSGHGRRDCTPVIWMDGQPADNLEIDEIPISDIEGIEIYSGPSSTPMQFSQRIAKAPCGTIVVWTRTPGTP